MDKNIDAMNPDTELLLMFAARNEHVKKVIVPKLEQGVWVISDRFTDASYAYQGEKDRFEEEHRDFFNKVREIFSNRASKYPERIKLIDASKNIDETSSQIKKILDLL
ncbi:MAG: dTMP kinase [Gammaproteobacteria bacterium]